MMIPCNISETVQYNYDERQIELQYKHTIISKTCNIIELTHDFTKQHTT